MGSLLRELGIRAHREGYRVELNEAMAKHIHHVAKSYQVLSLQSGTTRCFHCRNGTA